MIYSQQNIENIYKKNCSLMRKILDDCSFDGSKKDSSCLTILRLLCDIFHFMMHQMFLIGERSDL